MASPGPVVERLNNTLRPFAASVEPVAISPLTSTSSTLLSSNAFSLPFLDEEEDPDGEALPDTLTWSSVAFRWNDEAGTEGTLRNLGEGVDNLPGSEGSTEFLWTDVLEGLSLEMVITEI